MFVAIETVSAMGPGSVDVGGENVRQCEPHARPMSVCVCVGCVCVCVRIAHNKTHGHTHTGTQPVGKQQRPGPQLVTGRSVLQF